MTTVDASSGNVTLDTTTNNFQGAVKIDGVNVTVVDAGAIDLGASTVTGTYAVTATTGGDILRQWRVDNHWRGNLHSGKWSEYLSEQR